MEPLNAWFASMSAGSTFFIFFRHNPAYLIFKSTIAIGVYFEA
jgi:hypothetical protein